MSHLTVRFMHVNLNCADLDTSISFYETLGFEVLRRMSDLTEVAGGTLLRGLALPAPPSGRAAFLAPLGTADPARGWKSWPYPILDLIEWACPVSEEAPGRQLWQRGLARVALDCSDILATAQRMHTWGARFVSEPQIVLNKNGTRDGWVCLLDPDGVVIELIQLADVSAELGSLALRTASVGIVDSSSRKTESESQGG